MTAEKRDQDIYEQKGKYPSGWDMLGLTENEGCSHHDRLSPVSSFACFICKLRWG